MQGIGLYFDVTQTAQTPQGPWGISILAWGSLLFGIFAISTIGQLWCHIRKYEEIYEYALSFKGVVMSLAHDHLQISLLFKNTIDKPLAYQVSSQDSYTVVDGKCSKNDPNPISIISAGDLSEFRFAPLEDPKHSPITVKVVYKLVYGSPNKMKFREGKEMEFEAKYTSGEFYPDSMTYIRDL